MTMRTILTFLACLALAPLATGCGGAAGEYCELACECERCSDNEYDECIIQYEAAQDTADVYGCDVDYENAHICVLENNDCVNDRFVPELKCLDDLGDVNDCINDNSAVR
jgi:hypothetical protein